MAALPRLDAARPGGGGEGVAVTVCVRGAVVPIASGSLTSPA